jgi:putative restriction endonuclease
MAAGKLWTHNELFVALNVYHKLTFGQLHSRNPVIIELAKKLARGANSVAMKLSNFASLDPALKIRGIRGLESASKLDRAIWNEFHANLEEAVPASEEALRKLFGADDVANLEVIPKQGIRVRKEPTAPTEVIRTVKQRRGQEYFRDAVLNNYGARCGITQLAIRELLVASHILPWASYPTERLNVRNGICLSRLHDAAFDVGLISFDKNLNLVLSPRLKRELPQQTIREIFIAYEGEPLTVPDDAALPDLAFMARHRLDIFQEQA